MSTATREGQVSFAAPVNDPCFTSYKVFGNLESGVTPVVALHGGPGSGQQSLSPFIQLWTRYGIPIVFYDQIGCGSSTHLRHTVGDRSLWTESLFIAELENLLDHLHLRGGPGFSLLCHSWGAMLGAAFAATQPKGLQRLVLASGIASMELSNQSMTRWRTKLPTEAQQAIDEATQTGDFTDSSYLKAMNSLQKLTWYPTEPIPIGLQLSRKNRAEDATVYQSMIGSIFKPSGTLRDWTVIPRLPNINVPTLVYNGEFDSSDDECTRPFFELIPNVWWRTIPGGRHMSHHETPHLQDQILRLVGSFLEPGRGGLRMNAT